MTPNCFDFVTSMTRKGEPVRMPDLNIALEQLSFMEFSLEGTTQGCVFANAGACTVNLSSPERFAIHKLIVYGERPIRSGRSRPKTSYMRPRSSSGAWRTGERTNQGGLGTMRQGAEGLETKGISGPTGAVRQAPVLDFGLVSPDMRRQGLE